MARSLSVENNTYTSQLNVTVTSDIAGKTVRCGINGTTFKEIFSSVIPSTGKSPCIGNLKHSSINDHQPL